jgi:hypothetical protein
MMLKTDDHLDGMKDFVPSKKILQYEPISFIGKSENPELSTSESSPHIACKDDNSDQNINGFMNG